MLTKGGEAFCQRKLWVIIHKWNGGVDKRLGITPARSKQKHWWLAFLCKEVFKQGKEVVSGPLPAVGLLVSSDECKDELQRLDYIHSLKRRGVGELPAGVGPVGPESRAEPFRRDGRYFPLRLSL